MRNGNRPSWISRSSGNIALSSPNRVHLTRSRRMNVSRPLQPGLYENRMIELVDERQWNYYPMVPDFQKNSRLGSWESKSGNLSSKTRFHLSPSPFPSLPYLSTLFASLAPEVSLSTWFKYYLGDAQGWYAIAFMGYWRQLQHMMNIIHSQRNLIGTLRRPWGSPYHHGATIRRQCMFGMRRALRGFPVNYWNIVLMDGSDGTPNSIAPKLLQAAITV